MMNRRQFLVASIGASTLAGCVPAEGLFSNTPAAPAGDGPRIYRIDPGEAPRIQFRILDNVNALRATSGVPPLALNAALTAAAATHSRDMAIQNRPWHFGSDGSSPIDRAARAGYRGTVLGEAISETYESELQTIAAWMQQADTRAILMDPAARDLGAAFYQQDNGKLWWTVVVGDGGSSGPANATRG